MNLLLKNAASIDGSQTHDIGIENGRIVKKGPSLTDQAENVIDLEGHLVLPGFVESHLHLDIALMNPWERPGRPAPFRSPSELSALLEERRKYFTREDIEQRAGLAIEMASRHGVTAIRAQCHVDREIGLKHIEALLNVREKYRDRVTLQIVTFPQQGLLHQPETSNLLREAIKIGADVIGSSSNLDPLVSTPAYSKEYLDAAFAIALELDVDFDVHSDLGLPLHTTLEELEVVHLARRTIEFGYQGRVTAGHLCALDSAEPDVAKRAIDLICEAKINVVSQPDMYRLGREDQRSVRRGLTRVKQLHGAGVNVTFASNNVRDAYRPMGNFDLLEEGLVLAYGAHMDSVMELETIMQMCTVNAARALRLEDYGLNVGDHADLVVLNAVSPSAALVDQAEKLFVIKKGKLIAANWRKSEIYKI
jgi:cytosine deaminase